MGRDQIIYNQKKPEADVIFLLGSNRINPKGLKGDSAYQVAKNNGFQGTQEEWLSSLKGDKGDTYTLTPQDKTDIINVYKEDMTEQTNQILTDLREEVDETMTTMEQYKQNAKQYSDQSVTSAESAQISADRAERAVNQGGYMYFTIEDGDLIMEKTSNVDVDFSIEDGNLYMEVGNV